MSKVVSLNSNHPLVGVWRPDDEDESAEYTIAPARDGFTVSGLDRSDGERFEISSIRWNGFVLRFTSRMPSTDWLLDHEFVAIDGRRVEHRYTRREIWHRVLPDGDR
jgi:hypothetical protein